MTIKKLLFYSAILLAISVAVFISSLVSMAGNTQTIVDAQDKRTVSLLLADEIKDSSRDLTDAVRRYVITGNEQYYEDYMETLMIRTGEIPRPADWQIAPGQLVSLGELMVLANYTESELNLLEKSLRLSDELAVLEIEAMNLMQSYTDEKNDHSVSVKSNQEIARDLIFSPDYDAAIANIMEPFSLFKWELDQRLNSNIATKRENRDHSVNFIWVAFVVLIVMFTSFLLLVAFVIVRPVLLCNQFAREVAAGKLDCPLTYTSGNEIGSLAESLRYMLKSLLMRIELEEHMRSYSAVISLVDAGVIIKDKEGIVQEWNLGAENILGYKPEEIIGKATKYYTPEESHDAIDEIERRLKQSEHIAYADVVRKHKDGRLIDCSASYTPIFEDAGDFSGSVAVFHDVTDKKIAEQKLQKLAAIVSIADAGIIIKDKDGIVQEWNIGAKNILGYKPEEIIGHTTKHYAPEGEYASIDEIEKRLGEGEHITHVDVVRKHKDGRLIDCSASYTPIFDNNNEYTGSVSIFHDITEKKSTELKARRLAAIITAADAGIVIKDSECNILEWNIGSENILGYKPEEIIGKNTKYYVPDEYFAEIDEIKERLMRGEHTEHIEVVRKHKDGRLIDCSATYTPVFDEKGRFAGSVAVFQDISYKKVIERALKEAVQTAEKESKAKSIFLANMSHEIRTPMNGVIGFAELALAEEGITGSIKGYLGKIKTSADNLLTIINDILDVSKIEAGAMMLENVPFDLYEIFKDCETVSNLKAVEKGIALYFYAEPFIGKRLVGDPTKLRQVIVNLISNAIKFTNYGMVKLTAVVVEEKTDMVKIRFEVKDSGIGMTPEQMQSIFDPFIQADSSTTRKYGGTGLGLAITRNFVELMGGALDLESTLGLGSKFGFTLPFETVPVPEIKPQKKDEPSIVQKPMFSGEVLVCEDNATNQEIIEKHLSRVGLSCVIAANGKQGLEAVKERMQTGKLFDLILMDIHMPVMDGLEAMQKLLEMESRTPVVALTANAMITDKEKYLQKGMSDYLSKPFTAQQLWSCLVRHLSSIKYAPSSKAVISEGEARPAPDEQQIVVKKILNEKAGIENATGDEQFYEQLKRNFYRNNNGIIKILEKAICENDIVSAHRIAHSLKSSAGMLGAEKLSQIAANVEAALYGGRNNCTSELLEELESSLMEVLEIFGSFAEGEEPQKMHSEASLNMERACALIDKLTPLLKSGNPESVGYAGEVRTILSPFYKTCETLAAQIEDYEFDEAFEILCNIKTQLLKNI